MGPQIRYRDRESQAALSRMTEKSEGLRSMVASRLEEHLLETSKRDCVLERVWEGRERSCWQGSSGGWSYQADQDGVSPSFNFIFRLVVSLT